MFIESSHSSRLSSFCRFPPPQEAQRLSAVCHSDFDKPKFCLEWEIPLRTSFLLQNSTKKNSGGCGGLPSFPRPLLEVGKLLQRDLLFAGDEGHTVREGQILKGNIPCSSLVGGYHFRFPDLLWIMDMSPNLVGMTIVNTEVITLFFIMTATSCIPGNIIDS